MWKISKIFPVYPCVCVFQFLWCFAWNFINRLWIMHFQFKRYFVYFLHIQRIFSTENFLPFFSFKQCVNNCLFLEEETFCWILNTLWIIFSLISQTRSLAGILNYKRLTAKKSRKNIRRKTLLEFISVKLANALLFPKKIAAEGRKKSGKEKSLYGKVAYYQRAWDLSGFRTVMDWWDVIVLLDEAFYRFLWDCHKGWQTKVEKKSGFHEKFRRQLDKTLHFSITAMET